MHRISSGPLRGCPSSAADGFIITESFVPENEVVHGSLRTGCYPQGFEEEIHQTLTGFHITPNHRWTLLGLVDKWRVEHALLKDDFDGFEEPFIQGDAVAKEQPEDVEYDAVDDGWGGIEVACVHRGATSEIKAAVGWT
jgi:hypothetical protein